MQHGDFKFFKIKREWIRKVRATAGHRKNNKLTWSITIFQKCFLNQGMSIKHKSEDAPETRLNFRGIMYIRNRLKPFPDFISVNMELIS
jgi:hypothetical protein